MDNSTTEGKWYKVKKAKLGEFYRFENEPTLEEKQVFENLVFTLTPTTALTDVFAYRLEVVEPMVLPKYWHCFPGSAYLLCNLKDVYEVTENES